MCDEMDQVIRAQGWKAKITLQIFGKHRVERANRAFGTTCQVHREAVHENWLTSEHSSEGAFEWEV